MRIHIVQHVSFEPPGALLDWAKNHGHEVTLVEPALGHLLPTLQETDFLILMGGPMSVHDESTLPWLALEKRALREYIKADQKPLLGICLGAQLIAEALGGKVFSNKVREIGWFEVHFQASGSFEFAKSIELFHWHGETFDLPPGARLLAYSAATPVQAFTYKEKTLALQFHPEMNAEALEHLLSECADIIDSAKPFEQSASEIRKISPERMEKSIPFLDELLSHFLR